MIPKPDHWRYHWNNSPDVHLRRARRIIDTRLRPGPAAISTSPSGALSIAYAGLAQGHLNVLRLAERQRDKLDGDGAQVEEVPTSWRALRAGHFPDADLVLLGAEATTAARLPTHSALIAPFRVHLVVHTDTDLTTVRSRVSKRERWEFDRNRGRHDWNLTEDDTPAALEAFYRQMHLPTMRARHQENSRTEPIGVASDCILAHGRLFLLRQSGTPVAGVLCRHDGDVLTTRLLGVLHGADEHYDSGAFKAVYHLLLAWAVANQVRRVDFFGTEAFISKGIFQWKRKFAPHVVLPPNHFHTKRLYLTVRRDTPSVRDFLVANPVLRLAPHGQLQPVYFHDSDRPARQDISAKVRSVLEPKLVDLDRFLDSTEIPETTFSIP